MKEKMKPTPGPWKVDLNHQTRVTGKITIAIGNCITGHNWDPIVEVEKRPTPEETSANATIIAEAGTVYHETGLTPREILAQRDELIPALYYLLRRYLATADSSEGQSVVIEARRAIRLAGRACPDEDRYEAVEALGDNPGSRVDELVKLSQSATAPEPKN
jgi:hypothetical protein